LVGTTPPILIAKQNTSFEVFKQMSKGNSKTNLFLRREKRYKNIACSAAHSCCLFTLDNSRRRYRQDDTPLILLAL
jgi:hypothetical protein